MVLRVLTASVLALFCSRTPSDAQEIEGAPRWQLMRPTPGTHRAGIALDGMRTGKGCAGITGTADENNAGGGLTSSRTFTAGARPNARLSS